MIKHEKPLKHSVEQYMALNNKLFWNFLDNESMNESINKSFIVELLLLKNKKQYFVQYLLLEYLG